MPSPLVAIVVLTALTVTAAITVPTVGDEGELPDSLPLFGLPDVPLTLETLRIIAPYALALALVGLIESLMTAKLVDDITDTHSDKTRESWGQGVANVVTGFFGGMGGCAMIGQTMINVKQSGARTRLSTFLAGVFLLLLVVVLGDVVALIPMAALVAVMVLVSVSTFDWHSVAPATLRRMPKSETTVMVVTVAVVVATHNLAYGVGAGVLTAMVLFARRVAHLVEVIEREEPGRDRGRLRRRRPGLLRLQQRPRLPVRLRRRPRHRGHRHEPRPRLGRQLGRGARRRHDEVRAARQDRPDRRDERLERDDARPARRPAGQPLMAPATRTRGLLQIGDVAERTGLSLRSVRHYEEVGLLPPAERSPGGFRLYTDATVERLRVIMQMKPLEFTLEQMRELLESLDELAAGPAPQRRAALRAGLEDYRVEVERRTRTLQERLAGARALQDSLDEALSGDQQQAALTRGASAGSAARSPTAAQVTVAPRTRAAPRPAPG